VAFARFSQAARMRRPPDQGMHMKALNLIAATLALATAVAAPALAQEVHYTPGNYWDVAMIDVEDGQDQAYIDYLAAEWKKSQEFARSKGWIKAYHVLANQYARDGEPDLYLITEYEKIYDTPEQLRQQKEFEAFVKKTERQLTIESGQRVVMRKLKGNMQLRELLLK
jgi:hypothetical protein